MTVSPFREASNSDRLQPVKRSSLPESVNTKILFPNSFCPGACGVLAQRS
jgi:hypothetical protein